MSDGIGGVRQRRTNIVESQSRIGVKEIFEGRAFRQLSKKKFDGHTRSPDNRFTLHYVGVDLDSLSHGSLIQFYHRDGC